jgi:integrase
MPVLAQCPICREKQSLKNKMCKCGESLDKAKGSRRVKYWIDYRLPNGKQRRESVGSIKGCDGYSIKDARDALAKGKGVPINHHVEKALKGLPRALKHDFVITYKGQPIRQPGGLNRSFRTACKDAGVPFGRKTDNGITIHDIRRTVKTNMLIAGVDKIYRDIILGHSLQGMDAHYISPDDEALKRAMDRYTTWLDDQLKLQNVDHSVDQINSNQQHVTANP